MPDIRTLLERAVGDDPGSPDALERTRRRVHQRRRLRRAATVVVSLLLSTAALAFVLIRLAPGDGRDLAGSAPRGTIVYVKAGRTDARVGHDIYLPADPHIVARSFPSEGARALTRDSAIRTTPVPSPDGGWLAYGQVSVPDDDLAFELFVMRSDGTRPRLVLPCRAGVCDAVMPWAWLPDGSRILFSARLEGQSALWTVRPDGTDVRKVVDYGGPLLTGVTISPSGDAIAIATGRWGDPRLRIIDLGTQASREAALPSSIELIEGLSWSPNGSELVLGGRTSRERSALLAMAVSDESFRTITRCMTCQDTAPTWSPDGEWVAFVRGDEFASDVFVTSRDGAQTFAVTEGGHRECCVAWTVEVQQPR